ncbi:MAG: TetR/AcrR family transcriptional regulator [Bifidobacterium psychraerophilum]
MTQAGRSTHQRIVKKTIEVIERQGYEAVSLRSLAESLGLTTGAFYRHFSSKDDLLTEVGWRVADEVAVYVRPVDGEAPGRSDPYEDLIFIGSRLLELESKQPKLMDFLYFGPLNMGVSQTWGSEKAPALLSLMQEVCGRAVAKYGLGKTGEEFFIQVWAFVMGYGTLVRRGAVQSDEAFLRRTLSDLMGSVFSR